MQKGPRWPESHCHAHSSFGMTMTQAISKRTFLTEPYWSSNTVKSCYSNHAPIASSQSVISVNILAEREIGKKVRERSLGEGFGVLHH